MEFDVQLNADDMYRFNMYHAYHGTTGWMSILIGIMAYVVAITSYGRVTGTMTALYVVFGTLLLFYMPVNLKFASKHRVATQKEFQQPLHYALLEEHIAVSLGEEKSELPWKQVRKVVGTKHNLLIYTNRINAYVIPWREVEGKEDAVKEIISKHVDQKMIRM